MPFYKLLVQLPDSKLTLNLDLQNCFYFLFVVVVFVCFEYISVHLFMSVQYCVCVVHRYNNVNHSLHCAVCATANMLL